MGIMKQWLLEQSEKELKSMERKAKKDIDEIINEELFEKALSKDD